MKKSILANRRSAKKVTFNSLYWWRKEIRNTSNSWNLETKKYWNWKEVLNAPMLKNWK